jgi:hypothetical protein
MNARATVLWAAKRQPECRIVKLADVTALSFRFCRPTVCHQPALVRSPAADRALPPQRGRVEQTIDELLNGHDFDHLIS